MDSIPNDVNYEEVYDIIFKSFNNSESAKNIDATKNEILKNSLFKEDGYTLK